MPVHSLLFSADAPDQTPDLTEFDLSRLDARQMLWVDLASPTLAELRQVSRLLDCEPALLEISDEASARPSLINYGSCFRITARAVALERAASALEHESLTIVASPNCVITVHREGIAFLDSLREQDKGANTIGALSSESFIASMLDWLLDTYFLALEALIRDVDRVEVAILGKRMPPQFLQVLVTARKRVADLRRLLTSHREMFYGLARPDFLPPERAEARIDFEAVARHYERAEDELEHARDLVVGSFELLSTRAAQKTNDTMRALTFATVLMGVLALVAGVMGMNFTIPFFETGLFGFLVVSGSMLAFGALALLVAIRRNWI